MRKQDQIMRNIILTASGKRSEMESAEYLNTLLTMLDSASQPIINLIPPYIEAKPENVELPWNLRKKYFRLMGTHLRQKAWIIRFAKNLLPPDIPVILLKGHGLWGKVYSTIYPRLSSDVDILVKKEHFPILRQLFNDGAKYCGSTEIHSGFIIDHPYDIQVELHRELSSFGAFVTNYPRMWENAVPHPVFGFKNIRMMSSLDSFIHILMHSFNHGCLHPYMIVDLIRLSSDPEITIEGIKKKAREAGCYNLLKLVIGQINTQYSLNLFDGDPEITVSKVSFRKWIYMYIFSESKKKSSKRVKTMLHFILLDNGKNMIINLAVSIKANIIRAFRKISHHNKQR